MRVADSEVGYDTTPADLLGDRALIIAANRGLVTFDVAEDGRVQFQRGPGGVVTALASLAQHVEATWIACARTEVDAAWREGTLPLSGDAKIQVQFLAPDPAAYDGYYNVIANPLLWFLQHAMWDVSRAPVIDRATWRAWEDGYQVVNRLFAEAIVGPMRASPRSTLVMLQDYHLYLRRATCAT